MPLASSRVLTDPGCQERVRKGLQLLTPGGHNSKSASAAWAFSSGICHTPQVLCSRRTGPGALRTPKQVSPAPFSCDGTSLGSAGSRRPRVRDGQLDIEVGSKVGNESLGVRGPVGGTNCIEGVSESRGRRQRPQPQQCSPLPIGGACQGLVLWLGHPQDMGGQQAMAWPLAGRKIRLKAALVQGLCSKYLQPTWQRP